MIIDPIDRLVTREIRSALIEKPRNTLSSVVWTTISTMSAIYPKYYSRMRDRNVRIYETIRGRIMESFREEKNVR